MPIVKCGKKSFECKGVIFDKDGTLIDSLKVWPELITCRVNLLQEDLGFNTELAHIIERSMGLQRGSEMILRSPIVLGTREQTAAAVSTVLFLHLKIPWDICMQKVLDIFNQSDDQFSLRDQAIPIEGVEEALERLTAAGLKVGVATNDNLERTKQILDYARLAPYISAYACRDEVQAGKPSPDLFHLALTKLALTPPESIVVGDSLLDISMGQNGGVMATVGVLTGASARAELEGNADVVLESAADLGG